MLQKRNLTSAITIAIPSLYTATYPDSFIFIFPNNPPISSRSLYSSPPHLSYLPHSPLPLSLPLSLPFPNTPSTSLSPMSTSSPLPHIGSFCISPRHHNLTSYVTFHLPHLPLFQFSLAFFLYPIPVPSTMLLSISFCK